MVTIRQEEVDVPRKDLGRSNVSYYLATLLMYIQYHSEIGKQVAHQAEAYPGFCSMKQLTIFLLPPGWDASPSQGYPPALSLPVPIYTPGWREAL